MKFDFFLKKELKNLLKRQRTNKSFKSFDSIKTILLLFDKEDWDEVKKILSALKKDKKDVVAWSVRPKLPKEEFQEKTRTPYPSNIRFVNINTDVTWKQTLKPEVLEEFENLEYDACFDLTTSSNSHLLYLLAKNNSQFTVGIKESDSKLYDFILLKSNDETLSDTYKQIKYYLSKIC